MTEAVSIIYKHGTIIQWKMALQTCSIIRHLLQY
jgi:hypothetical protein